MPAQHAETSASPAADTPASWAESKSSRPMTAATRRAALSVPTARTVWMGARPACALAPPVAPSTTACRPEAGAEGRSRRRTTRWSARRRRPRRAEARSSGANPLDGSSGEQDRRGGSHETAQSGTLGGGPQPEPRVPTLGVDTPRLHRVRWCMTRLWTQWNFRDLLTRSSTRRSSTTLSRTTCAITNSCRGLCNSRPEHRGGPGVSPLPVQALRRGRCSDSRPSRGVAQIVRRAADQL